jgi:anaerobic sulfite reductase subunit A
VDESFDVPEDHIAFEFEFMAYLCEETKAALAAKDDAKFSALLTDQMNFLTDHLLNWIPQFCADIGNFAETGFYKGVGKITSGYLHLEQLILAEMIADTAA